MNKIKNLVVIGAGVMGNGIAQVAAQAGFEVVINDVEERFLARSLDNIKKSLGKMKEKGKITEDEMGKVLARIRGTLDIKDAVRIADLVIEAVPEELELKQRIFKQIDEMSPVIPSWPRMHLQYQQQLLDQSPRGKKKPLGRIFSIRYR